MSILNPPPAIVGKDEWGRPVFKSRKPLLDRLSEAIAWGIPDNESRGCSASEFVSLLAEARDEIVRLRGDK